MSSDFLVSRSDLRQCRLTDNEKAPEVHPGQVLLHVDKFAFTANNITYAVFGDAMAYWAFFPAPEGWGRIPVWGYADVVRSRHDAIREGERIYGYVPMSTQFVLQPDRVSEGRLVDAMPHRRQLPAAYQDYLRVGTDAAQRPFENHQALLRPLFSTAFLIDDFLSDNNLFGARRVVLSSASSKTSLGLAHLLRLRRPGGGEVVGLTAAGNIAFCESTGYYERVLNYDALSQLSAETPTVFVDMAGNGKLLHDIHHHFRDNLKYSCMVGGTHWEKRETQHSLPGAKPTFFFAPTQLQKRVKDWGGPGLMQRIGDATRGFIPTTQSWLKIIHGRGAAAVESVYRETLEGRVPPEQGHILSL